MNIIESCPAGIPVGWLKIITIKVNIMINFVDVKDIQVKNVRADSNPNNQNRIRKSWVLALTEETKQAIKDKIKDSEARFAFYKSIDDEVAEKWIELMRKHYNESIKAGAKIVTDRHGGERLENDYCVDADEQLVAAGQIVAEELTATFAA